MEDGKRLTLKEAAARLGIATATMRNWFKSGRVKNVGTNHEIYFLERDIRDLKIGINSGETPYLRSRRNKSAVSYKFVPDGYLLSKMHQELAEQIVKLARDWNRTDQLLILLELYLRLLVDKDQTIKKQVDGTGCLVEAWLGDQLKLGYYVPIVEEFYQLIGRVEVSYGELTKLSQLGIRYQSGEDILGLVYMGLSSLGSRKIAGSYYTPTKIVDRLIEDSLQYYKAKQNPKVIDPCCGSGNFLLRFFYKWRHRLGNAGYSLADSEQILLQEIITGYDLDPIAVMLTKMNLSLASEYPEFLDQLQIFCEDTLLAKFDGNGYDLVIGNPPWGAQFSPIQLTQLVERYETVANNSGVDSFAVFIEWGILHVVPRGIISYVLPESFLTVGLHKFARELVIEHGQVKEIAQLGTVFSQVNAPVITGIIQKQAWPAHEHVLIKKNEKNLSLARTYFVNQDLRFNVLGTELDYRIIDRFHKLDGVKYLRGNAEFALGIVTGNNKKHLKKTPISKNSELVITGRDIVSYGIKTCEYFLDLQPHLYQQIAPERLYRAPEKLLYRFINRNLVFAYDNKQRLSINSANIVIPQVPGLEIKYVLALLNSRVAQFYHSIIDPSVKVLRSQLETIPLCSCSKQGQGIVVKLVDNLLTETNHNQREAIYEEIDQIIMDYYQLPAKHQDYIRSKIKKVKLLY